MPLRQKSKQDFFDPLIMNQVHANLRLIMASRSYSAVSAHVASSLFLLMIAHIRAELTGAILVFGAVIVASSLIRLVCARSLLATSPGKYAWVCFLFCAGGQALGWGFFTVYVMSYFSFTHFYSLMVMLVSASLGAGSTSSLGGDLRVARGFLFLLLGSVISWLFVKGGAEHNWLGVNVLIFLWFNLAQAKMQNEVLTSAEYWKLTAAEAESRLRGVFDAVPSQIIVVNDDLMYADTNANAKRDLFMMNDIRGKSIGTVERSPDVARMLRETVLALREKGSITQEYREFNESDDSGVCKYWHINASISDGESGKQYILNLTDISEVKKTAIELTQAREKSERLAKSAAIGELAAGMAHEVNNPLTILAGHLMLMSKDRDGSLSKINLINHQIRRIAGVVHGFLKYAKMDTARDNEQVDLRAAVEDGASLVAQEVAHFRCKVFIESNSLQILGYIHRESFTSAVAGLIIQMISERANDESHLYVTFHRRSLGVVGGLPRNHTTLRFEMSNEVDRDGSWIVPVMSKAELPGTSYHWIGATIVKDILQRHGATIVRPAQSNQVVEISFPEC
jgi:hypothetical protein